MIEAYSQVGNTPLVRLNILQPNEGASIWLKIESGNPTGSYKDRMAISVIGNALKRGDLVYGQRVIEYTGGSTGSSLAFACASVGAKFTAIFSDAFSDAKRLTMEAFGAEVIVVPSNGRGITPELIQEMKELSQLKVSELDAFYADQFGSKDVLIGYEPMGTEIANQINGEVSILCGAVGTGAALMGTLQGLKKSKKFPKAIAFEPLQSPLLTKGYGGPHKVEGIGVGFYPPFLDAKLIDRFLAIDQNEAFEMRKILAIKHGIFCGTSTGMNVVGAIKLARKMPPEENIVTFGCDSGLKYL
tara:strand:- start:622 stop:1524 length:903 start_codon:yes stop_codon:yes gene_type:complete